MSDAIISGMLLDDAGISHGEEPCKRGCSWQIRFQEEQANAEGGDDPPAEPVFTCEKCKRLVCYCGGHGCEIGAPENIGDARAFCDDCSGVLMETMEASP